MEKRINVIEMRNILSGLIDKGFGNKFIGVSEYYIGKNFDDGGENDVWNSVNFGSIYYDEIPRTIEQKDLVKKNLDDMKFKIETRTWETNYRGLVLICASKKPYSLGELLNICGDYQYYRIIDTLGYEPSQFDDVCGYAIGVGKLVDCRRMTKEDEDACFVFYNPNLWCHIYEDVKPIIPIPFKGKQGWSMVDDNIFKQIQYESINDVINQLKNDKL